MRTRGARGRAEQSRRLYQLGLWFAAAVALAVVAASVLALTTGGAAVRSPAQPAPPNAPAQLRISTAGDDAQCARGPRARACSSFLKAYSLARPGDVVEVEPGAYDGFTLSGNKGGPPITFRASKDAAPANFTTRVDLVDLAGVTFDGLQFRAADGGAAGDLLLDKCNANIVIRNARASGTFGVLEGNRNVTFVGGSWGGYSNHEDSGFYWVGRDACADGSMPGPSRNVVIDRVTFHDVYYQVPSAQWGGNHPDCLQLDGAVDGLVIRNSRFLRCGNSFLMVTPDLGPPGMGDILNLTVENNLFWLLGNESYHGIQFNNNTEGLFCGNLVFRNNTYIPANPRALGPFSPVRVECAPKPGYRDAIVTGNIFESGAGPCGRFATWSHNVFERRPVCGAKSRRGAVKFVARERGDFHLLRGARAIDAGNPRSFPARDIDGHRRPWGKAPEAGYDERREPPKGRRG
jgi:hypothetical protein